jgi:hypothetical protein
MARSPQLVLFRRYNGGYVVPGEQRGPQPKLRSALDPEPFAAWLNQQPGSSTELARELGCHESLVRRRRRGASRVSPRVVERWGLLLTDEPRLVERLYGA